MNAHDTAQELVVSWINGNRSHVVEELLSYPTAEACAIALYMANMMSLEDYLSFRSQVENRIDD